MDGFLNSLWVKAVIPIRPHHERVPLNWLQQVEGTNGIGPGDMYIGPEARHQGLSNVDPGSLQLRRKRPQTDRFQGRHGERLLRPVPMLPRLICARGSNSRSYTAMPPPEMPARSKEWRIAFQRDQRDGRRFAHFRQSSLHHSESAFGWYAVFIVPHHRSHAGDFDNWQHINVFQKAGLPIKAFEV